MRLRFSEYAATLGEAEEKAKLTAARFFAGRAFDLAATEGYVDVEVRTGTGEISGRGWKVDFEATG